MPFTNLLANVNVTPNTSGLFGISELENTPSA